MARTLCFVHHPTEVHLASLTPGVNMVGYSISLDDFYLKPTRLMLKKHNILN